MNNIYQQQPPVLPVENVKIPEAQAIKLINGIPVFLIESGTEDIIRLEFTFSAGQVREKSALIASTTNMMLTEGSEYHKAEEINRMLDFYGAFISLSLEKDRAGIVIYLLSKHLQRILELSREILFSPAFPESELDTLLKKRLRWFLVNREKVQNIAMDQFFESVFGRSHPYGRKVKEDDFANIDPPMLKKFHEKNYTSSNMAIIISGKPPANTTDLLEKHFGDLPEFTYQGNEEIQKPEGENNRKLHIARQGALQTAIRIGSATINKRHPDYPGLKILDTILGGYFGSRLMKNIREDKGYTYGVNSLVTSFDLSGYKVISTEVSARNSRNAVEEIYNEINRLRNEPVGESELELVRNYMSGEMLRMFDGPFALAESFRAAWEFGLDNDYYYRLAEKIRTISPDEITGLAQTYYNIDELYQITAGVE